MDAQTYMATIKSLEDRVASAGQELADAVNAKASSDATFSQMIVSLETQLDSVNGLLKDEKTAREKCESECEQCEADLTAEKVLCADLAARLEVERTASQQYNTRIDAFIALMQKEEAQEDAEEEQEARDFEIDVVRGGDNLTRKLKVRMV